MLSLDLIKMTDGKNLFIIKKCSYVDRIKLFFFAFDELLNPTIQVGRRGKKEGLGTRDIIGRVGRLDSLPVWRKP